MDATITTTEQRIPCEFVTSWRAVVGIMLRKNFDYPFVLDAGRESVHKIHSFFVLHPFGVLFVANNGEVVGGLEKVMPNQRGITCNKPFRYVIEYPLPNNSLSNALIGSIIGFY